MADTNKSIRVSEEVHEKVAQIAGSNFRGMGDQVAYWAAHTCAHPQENRIEVNIVAAPVMQATKKSTARVGKNQPFRGFFCSQCGQLVSPELPEEVTNAFSQLEGVVS